jgi:hypothetical protein
VKLIISLLAAVIIFYGSALKWRRGVKAVFLLLVLEGALRKWLLPQANEMIYFLKDIVLLGAYFNFYCFSDSDKKFLSRVSLINIIIFITIGWCLFQVFNPSLGSPLLGLFGLRGYLLYLPLIWMVPSLFQTEEEVYKFLRSHLLLTIPVGLIGIAQFFSPASSFINAYSNEEAQAVVTFGINSAVRITGTFPYISGYGVYLIICFGLLIFMLSVKQPPRWQVVTLVELLLVSVNSFMTGSRGTIFAEVLFLVGYLGAKGLATPVSSLRLIRKLILPILVIAIAASIWFRPAINAFWQRATHYRDIPERISLSFTEPLDFVRVKELDSYGIGATHQAAPILRRALDLPAGETIRVPNEGEMGRIVLELGPIGFIFWYGLRLSILILLIHTFLKLKRPFLRQLALTAFLLQAIQINSFLVFLNTYAVYYWFFSGLIFLLPQLEQTENWQREQQFQQDVLSSYFPDSSYR